MNLITITFTIIMLLSCSHSQDEAVQSNLDSSSEILEWSYLPVNSPTIQSEYAMAYDTTTKQIIAYGGRTGFTEFNNVNETWAFSLEIEKWINLNAVNMPPWRSSHTMVYDPIRQKVLMFGGNDFTKAFNDLWEYDPNTNRWTELSPQNRPQARQMHGMAYIPNRDVIIIFGGRKLNGGAFFNDIWEYHHITNEWIKLEPINSPPITDHVNIAYNESVEKLVLYTGADQIRTHETWAYDFVLNSWTNLNSTNPPNNDHSNMGYDPLNDRILLFGNSTGPDEMHVWIFEYSSNKWTDISSDSISSIDYIIEHDAMVYVNDRNSFIQYGGCCSNNTLEILIGNLK